MGFCVRRSLWAATVLVACQRAEGPGEELTEWRFVQDLRIGSGSNDTDGFSDLKGILVTRSGNIWALEASTQNIRVFDPAGAPLRRIGRKGQDDHAIRYSVSIPFHPEPVEAFDWTGEALWCAPTGAEYRLFKLGIGHDDTLARIARRGVPVPVAERERDSAIAEVREFLAQMNEPDADWSRIPAVKPLVAGAFIDDASRLWVRRMTADGTTRFDIWTADGGPVATVRIPHAVIWWVRPVTRDSIIWRAARDPDGIPYLVRGRVGAPAREPRNARH